MDGMGFFLTESGTGTASTVLRYRRDTLRLERNDHLAPTRPIGPGPMGENDTHIIFSAASHAQRATDYLHGLQGT